MQGRIAPLIEERANWLSAERPQVRLPRALLDHLLSDEKTGKLDVQMQDWGYLSVGALGKTAWFAAARAPLDVVASNLRAQAKTMSRHWPSRGRCFPSRPRGWFGQSILTGGL